MDTVYQEIILHLIHTPAQSTQWNTEGESNEGQKL